MVKLDVMKSATAAILLAFSSGAAPAQEQVTNVKVQVDFLTNRVWVEERPDNGLPGVMVVFLANGTLVQDSCWETYTTTKWRRIPPHSLSWEENGVAVVATVREASAEQLVLSITAGLTKSDRRYLPQKTPYICPEMSR